MGGMEWHGMAWYGIGLNYTYKEILNALKTKGRCKDVILLLSPLLIAKSDFHQH